MSKVKDIALSSKGIKRVELDGERQLRVIATAPTLDRDLEVIDTATIRIPVKPKGLKYASELTTADQVDVPFLIDHEWALEKQAGHIKSLVINDLGELEAVVQLANVENGDRVYELAKNGSLGNSFSIGFTLQNATDEDGVIKNVELLELSAVFKGSNRDARLLEVKSVKGQNMSEAEKLKAEIAVKQQELADMEAKEAEVEETKDDGATEQAVETDEATETVEVQTEDVEAEVVEVKDAEVEAEAEQEEELAEETLNTDTEEVSEKEVEMTEAEKKSIKTAEAVQEVQTKSFDKVDHAAKQFVAYLNKDAKALKELNEEALKTYTGTKATYLNANVSADGGAIVPSAALLEDVYSMLDVYSGVASDIRVITLESGDSLDIASLVDDVVMTEVANEGGDKAVTKPVFGESDISLREFAGIAILTKKLVRQAAVNVYDILVQSFARAIARKRAELILTDATSGIVNNAGATSIDTAAAIPTYAELTSGIWSVPVAAVGGAKFYISREALGAIAAEEDAAGNSYVTLDGETGLTGRFRNGFRFTVEESLGVAGAPHAVFGNFTRFGILLRQGAVESETFDTGIVVDGSAVEHNLLQQNKLAHRVAFYENAGFPVPSAFAVYEPATS